MTVTKFFSQPNHLIIHTMGIVTTAGYIYLGRAVDSSAGLSIEVFLLLLFSAAVISFVLFFYAHHNIEAANDSLHKPLDRLPLAPVIAWAIVFRLTGLFFSPIYEDDFYRYLWDGFLFSYLGTPYGPAPSDFFGDTSIPETMQSILDGTNYPDIPTIYAPVLQYSFLLSHWLFPADVLGLKLLYTIVDIGLIFVLAALSNRHAVILYAWCPLIIKEIAFTAHPDGLGVFLLIASVLALRRLRLKTAAVLLALSVCTKVFALLLAPLILMRCKLQHIGLFALTVALIYTPFVLSSNADLAGLAVFARDWQFNGSIHALLVHGLNEGAAKWLCAIFFISFYIVYSGYFFLNKQQLIPRGDWIFAVFFLLSPVVNAWYLIWMLAFAAIFPSRWAWSASVAVLLSYVTGATVDSGHMALYQQPLWARVLEYSLVVVALCFDIREWCHRKYQRFTFSRFS